MEQKKMFEEISPIKLFFIASIPGGISMLASSLYGLLDGIFVGRILGETAFAALNLAFPFVIFNFSLADLIGVGSAVPISIQLGQKKEKEADNIFTCACLMIVITGVLMGGSLYIAAPFLMHLLGASGELAELGARYMRVYALCSPVTTVVFAMDNYLRICGKIKMSMNLNILMSGLSAGFEFLFLGVFRFGIWGAAFATCCGMIICAAIAFFPFLRGELQLHFCKPKFSKVLIQQIIECGSPEFLSNIAGRISSVVLNVALLRFGGKNAVSIYGILMYAGESMQSFLYGVCDSLQPAVGYNWGAKRKDRVKALEKCCFTACALISFVTAMLMLLFPEPIINLFVKNVDVDFMNIAVGAMRVFSLTFVTRWISFATQSYMTAIDRPVYASILSVSTALIFPMTLIVILWPLKLQGIWINFPMTYALAALLAIIIMFRFRKEQKKED